MRGKESVLKLAVEFSVEPAQIRSWIRLGADPTPTKPEKWTRLCDRCQDNPRMTNSRLCEDCLDSIREDRELDANDQTYVERDEQLDEWEPY
jgi:hypothetical protein